MTPATNRQYDIATPRDIATTEIYPPDPGTCTLNEYKIKYPLHQDIESTLFNFLLLNVYDLVNCPHLHIF